MLRLLSGGPRRTPEAQRQVEEACAGLTLYHMATCPFCWRVRWAMRRMGLPIRLVNVLSDPDAQMDLAIRGGKMQVPCLHIHTDHGSHWFYESADIIAWLQKQFGGQ